MARGMAAADRLCCRCARPTRGQMRARTSEERSSARRAAIVATTTDHLDRSPPEATELAAAAARAEAWAGEPFLHADEDPAVVLAPGTARRRALDEALAELEAGRGEPSPEWKVRFGLMLGLERVLVREPPRLASGTELRRHQVDALAGMLTELIAANQREERTRTATATATAELVEESTRRRTRTSSAARGAERRGRGGRPATAPTPAPSRRFRFRHPTASGKTIAAAGFVEAARTLGVLILTHRRLLVSQFTRDLTTRATATGSRTRSSSAATRHRARTRSRSRPTPGSRATSARSRATRTSS